MGRDEGKEREGEGKRIRKWREEGKEGERKKEREGEIGGGDMKGRRERERGRGGRDRREGGMKGRRERERRSREGDEKTDRYTGNEENKEDRQIEMEMIGQDRQTVTDRIKEKLIKERPTDAQADSLRQKKNMQIDTGTDIQRDAEELRQTDGVKLG